MAILKQHYEQMIGRQLDYILKQEDMIQLINL